MVVLFIILLSFVHAFLILLRPRQNYSLDEPTNNDDPNNSWDLTERFYRNHYKSIICSTA